MSQVRKPCAAMVCIDHGAFLTPVPIPDIGDAPHQRATTQPASASDTVKDQNRTRGTGETDR